jgi:hypothetical protein
LWQKNIFENQPFKKFRKKFIPNFLQYGTDFETKGYKNQVIMKKLFLILFVAAGSFIGKPATAQVSININIGSQPAWGL